MINFLYKYKAFFIGFLIVIPLFYVLGATGIIILPEEKDPFEFSFYTLFWGTMIALPIHFWAYLKEKKKTVYMVLSLVILLIVTMVIDRKMNFPDNPITFLMLMTFWFGWAYVLIPRFISKYWRLILLFYVPLFLYFLYLRMFSGNLDDYLRIKEGFPFYIFFIPIPILLALWVFEQWKWLQNLKAEKAKAELSLLKTQINPHFFFNTLNNLYALSLKNSDQAPQVILMLSDMMRYTIYEGEKEFVRLGDESVYLKNYIELHKIRYKKEVEIEIEEQINTDTLVAPLMYIILLENAFKHGVESLAENAYIHVKLVETQEFISFEIENNYEPRSTADSHGIGLDNLKKRLNLLYHNRYNLKVDKQDQTYRTSLKIKKNV
ncbi:MAG: sensor histidine kinase [Flavobacteriaceae bacterium]